MLFTISCTNIRTNIHLYIYVHPTYNILLSFFHTSQLPLKIIYHCFYRFTSSVYRQTCGSSRKNFVNTWKRSDFYSLLLVDILDNIYGVRLLTSAWKLNNGGRFSNYLFKSKSQLQNDAASWYNQLDITFVASSLRFV